MLRQCERRVPFVSAALHFPATEQAEFTFPAAQAVPQAFLL